jgi:hypothetical protein
MPLFGIRRISKAARGFPNSHLAFPGASSPMHTQTRKKILSSSRCVMCPATHYIFIVHIIIIMLKNGCNKEEFFLEEEVVAKMKKWYQFLIFFSPIL